MKETQIQKKKKKKSQADPPYEAEFIVWIPHFK